MPQGADVPHPVKEVKAKWSKRLPTSKGRLHPSKEKEEMVGKFSVWRMIKVYGMIILVMAMDIDGCVLNKAVNQEKSRPINRTVTIDLSSRLSSSRQPQFGHACLPNLKLQRSGLRPARPLSRQSRKQLQEFH